jgi:hypothetical protein
MALFYERLNRDGPGECRHLCVAGLEDLSPIHFILTVIRVQIYLRANGFNPALVKGTGSGKI